MATADFVDVAPAAAEAPLRRPRRALDRLGGVLARRLDVALGERDVGQPQGGRDVVGPGQRAEQRALGRGRQAERPVAVTELEQRALRTHRSILRDPAQRCAADGPAKTRPARISFQPRQFTTTSSETKRREADRGAPPEAQ